ncbi:MOSC domain-containing protein [Acetobacter nitrogenifigens]|uniref:Molybdenum cofactor sulfurase n=1 Tax=Acetobacter nitrogenifigens DSM 23921 = NBRC 105050 TaxID=1120919 RepID=A0A511XER4_9PROT|nr:MOSC N-terminal beta barrel domain-containing protein [Acetobacter nitrogenifigens]GEN61428.1 molybdenum cofactor sulfurase [Acetobacter nitrogenifigens DSM 23921 = NBRC 105050]
MKVSSLHIYPVKSLRGLSPTHVDMDPWGPRGDRRWVVVDVDGVFITQRTNAAMARISVTPTPDGLTLQRDGDASLAASRPSGGATRVRVWRSDVTGNDAGDEAAAWLEAALGRPSRLVYMDAPESARPGEHDGQEFHVSFADGFPGLLCTEASLDDLNARLDRAVPMTRFRPNVVVEGASAWAEDEWTRIRIGQVELALVKPCSRCIVTTIDQESGSIVVPGQPLKTLAGFRRTPEGIMFGQNFLVEKTGTIRKGDTVEILERRAAT